MSEMGKAMMGTGEAEGERRALEAAEAAICNPLLDDTSMKGARSVLINITGGPDMTLFEADEAANRIRQEVDGEAYIIFGSTFDETLEGRMRVSVVSTGMDGQAAVRPVPRVLDVLKAEGGTMTPSAPAAKEESAQTPIMAELPIEAPQAAPAPMALDMAGAEETDEVDDFVQDEQAVPEIDLGAAPTATPSTGYEDAFIPPAPTERASNPEAQQADPFRAADMANGAGEQPAADPAAEKVAAEQKARSRALSLFEKVTGAARAKEMTADKTAAVQPFRKPEPVVKPQPASPETGSLLSAVSEDRPTVQSAASEDDMLDIPAFLRRQAN